MNKADLVEAATSGGGGRFAPAVSAGGALRRASLYGVREQALEAKANRDPALLEAQGGLGAR